MLVYILIRIFQVFLSFCPHKLLLFIGKGLGLFAYFIIAGKRKIVIENFKNTVVGRNLTEKELQKNCMNVFKNAGITLVEVLVLEKFKHKWKKNLSISELDMEKAKKYMEIGCVFLLSHFNNWEMITVMADKLNKPVLTVGQKIKNKYLDNWVKKNRQDMGVKLTDKKRFIKDSLRFLAQGGSVAVFTDQNAGRHGEQLEFLGKKASTFTTAGVLSIRTDVPIVPVFDVRDNKTGKHEIVVSDAINPKEFLEKYRSKEIAAIEMTKAMLHVLEKMIKKYPQSWFWLHRRWKK